MELPKFCGVCKKKEIPEYKNICEDCLKKSEQRPLEKVSVWLKRNSSKDLELYYCPKCRMPILQYTGDEVMEIPGESPTSLPIVIKCKNKECPRIYYFVTFGDDEPNGFLYSRTTIAIS